MHIPALLGQHFLRQLLATIRFSGLEKWENVYSVTVVVVGVGEFIFEIQLKSDRLQLHMFALSCFPILIPALIYSSNGTFRSSYG